MITTTRLLNCGIYDQPVPSENAVHSLEHGAVWVTYQPDLPQAEVDKLRQLVRGHSHLLLSPYPDLPQPVVASGWGVQLQLPGAMIPAWPASSRSMNKGHRRPSVERNAAAAPGILSADTILEEDMQNQASLGHVEAQRAIEAIKAELLRRGKAAVIAVADAHGELIGLLRLDRRAPAVDPDRDEQSLDRRARA